MIIGQARPDAAVDLLDRLPCARRIAIGMAREVVTALSAEGHAVRLVSMPCTEVFARQDQAYRDSVLPPTVRKRIAIEAGSTDFWYRYVGLDGAVIGLDHFGASAPAAALFEHFGLTAAKATASARALLGA